MTDTITNFLQWVDNFLNFEKLPNKNIFWLDMMKAICEKFENPQNEIPSIHVAGSKGKGSVSAMISSILTTAGKKTGVYSSPHIEDFRERIKLNDSFFPDEIYKKASEQLILKFNQIKNELPKDRVVTWFELVTIYAFLCMKIAQVDYSIYEVGLGGRLDATNIIIPELSIINSIELEHTEFLGNTVEKIAFEKAGIIKKGIPVLCANQTESVKKVFINVAKENNSKIYFADELCKNIFYKYVQTNNQKLMNVHIESNLFSRPLNFNTKMFGSFQAHNAFLAAAAIRLTNPDILEDIIEEGLSNVSLPGRFEIIKLKSQKNLTNNENFCYAIIDGAHTVNSINFTLETLQNIFPNKKANLLFACAADKDVERIANLFTSKFDKIFLTRPGLTKSSDSQKLKTAFTKANIDFTYSDDFEQIIFNSIKESILENKILLITGSFYLASEVKKIIQCKFVQLDE